MSMLKRVFPCGSYILSRILTALSNPTEKIRMELNAASNEFSTLFSRVLTFSTFCFYLLWI